MKSRLAKNIIAVSISNVLVKIVSALVGILIARFLGVTKMGYYAAAVNFSSLVGVFANSGLKDVLIKKIAVGQEETASFLGTATLIQFLLSGFVFLLMVLIANLSGFPPLVIELIYIAGLAGFFYELIEFLFSYYYGLEKMEKITVIRICSSSLTLGFIVTALYFKAELIGVAWARLLVTSVIMFSLLYLIFRESNFRINTSLIKPLIKEGIPFGLNTFFYIAYFRVGIVILSYYVSAAELGLFDAAFKILTLLYVIPGILSTALYPMLFRLGSGTDKVHSELIQNLLKYLCLLCFPMSVFIFSFADEIIVLVYGNEFSMAGEFLQILSPLLVLQCINYPLADALTTRGFQKTRTVVIGCILLITVLFNFLLINFYGTFGAALSTIIIEMLLVIIFNRIVNRLLYKTSLLKNLKGVIIASVSLLVVLYCLRVFTENIFIAVWFTLFFYPAFLLLFRVIDKKDIEIMKGGFKTHP